MLYERRSADLHNGPSEFCDLFGPDRILVHVSTFIGYFMVRKVAPGRELLQASGTVTGRLALWLAARGYVSPELARAYSVEAKAATRDALAHHRPRTPNYPSARAILDW